MWTQWLLDASEQTHRKHHGEELQRERERAQHAVFFLYSSVSNVMGLKMPDTEIVNAIAPERFTYSAVHALCSENVSKK